MLWDKIKLIWSALWSTDVKQVLMMMSTRQWIVSAIGFLLFALVCMVINIAILAMMIMPWYYVVLGIASFVSVGCFFSWGFDKIIRNFDEEK